MQKGNKDIIVKVVKIFDLVMHGDILYISEKR